MARQTILTIETTGPGLYEFTDKVQAFVGGETTGSALLTMFVRHTSCSIIMQENADPDVQRDLAAFLNRLVPDAEDSAMSYLRHCSEGPDDMPAHIKAALTQTSIGIPVADGRMMLGTWQGIYLWEHRTTPHRREVVLHIS